MPSDIPLPYITFWITSLFMQPMNKRYQTMRAKTSPRVDSQTSGSTGGRAAIHRGRVAIDRWLQGALAEGKEIDLAATELGRMHRLR